MSERGREALRAVSDVIDHRTSCPLPRGELFLGFDFLDRYWVQYEGDYVKQLRAAAQCLGLSLLGVNLNPRWSMELTEACRYDELRDYFTVGCINGPVAGVIQHLGFSKTMVSLRKDKAMFSDIIGVVTDEIESSIELADGNGFGAFAVADDIAGGNGLLFSLDDFLDLMLPSYGAIAAILREKGMRAIFHCDGDTRSIIGPLLDSGYQCIHPVDIQAGMDLYELGRTFGESATFMGHVDAVAWGAERVADEVSRAESVFHRGGLIIGSSGGISLGTLTPGTRALYPGLARREDR